MKKRILVKATFLFLLVISFPWKSQSQNMINFERLNDKTLIVKAGTVYPDMVVAISSQKGIILIDSGISPTLSKEYRNIIEEEFGRDDFAYVINTHHHFDHTNGNQVFSDAMIIAHENSVKEMLKSIEGKTEFIKSRRERFLRRERLAQTLNPEIALCKRLNDLVFMSRNMCNDLESNFTLTLPSLTFNKKLSINLGDMHLELFHFPPGFHSNNDLIAVIPELGFIFPGDLLPEVESFAHIDSNNNLEEAIKILDEVFKSCEKLKHIISIHNGIMPPTRFVNFRNNLNKMNQERKTKKPAVVLVEKMLLKIEIDEAIKQVDKLINSKNSNYYLWEGDLVNFANQFFNEGKTKESIRLFEYNSKLFPESLNAFEWLGDIYFKIGEFQKATTAFERALKIFPRNSFAKDMLFQIENR